MGNVESLRYLGPEIVLMAAIVCLFLINFFTAKRPEVSARPFSTVAWVGVMLSLLLHATETSGLPATALFLGMIDFDGVGIFAKFVFGSAGLLTIIFSQKSRDLAKSDAPSYYIILLTLIIGMNFLAMASNLLMIYLSLEIVSITSYILTGYVRGVRRSAEAALKYVIYGGVASGVMLYGFSLLYGLTGTLSLAGVSHYLVHTPVDRGVLFLAFILSLAGFGFKVAAFPFHMWSPDVYEGAPTPFTAFLSVAPKAAGITVLMRYLITAFFTNGEGLGLVDIKALGVTQVIAVFAMVTMSFGNIAALSQQNIKRLLAYSSIAHAGTMLMGIAAMNAETIPAVLFYFVAYLIMNLGAFLVVMIVAHQFGVEELDGYKGFGRRGGAGAGIAIAMTLFMLSLTGLPPTVGFIGKFYIFAAVIHSKLYWLAIVGAINSVISLYYYMRVVKVMFFDDPADEKVVALRPLRYATVLGLLAAATLYLGLFWGPLAQWTLDHATFLIAA